MKTTYFGVAFALGLAIAASQKNPGAFSRLHYKGPSSMSVIAIYYKGNYQQPKCYGALVNFDVVLVPCSCVMKQLDVKDMATWWNHRIKKKVQADQPSDYKALVMTHEYHKDTVKNKLMAPVKRISVSDKCDTLFQYNVAKIELSKPIEGAKLAWVAYPFEDQMRSLLQYGLVGTAVRGLCYVHKWSVYDGPGWGSKVPEPMLLQHDVSMTVWSACKGLVCPRFVIPPRNATIHQDNKICDNKVTESRYCVVWDSDFPFCRVVPGTPVFCEAGALVGLSGFVHNETQWCPDEGRQKFAVMEGLDLALPLIKYDLRVINVMPAKSP